MFNKKILSLSVITSSACNLNCSFCYLHKNNSYKEFHKLLTKAWEDGTYIKNLDKVFTKLEANKNDIQEIHFWGGETLIQVDTIAKNVPAIYKVFPNLQEWHMSTNWVINIQSYFNFLLEVDKYACPQTEIIVQISIDGPPGKCSENGHDGWGVYRKNFTDFLNLVNQHKFKNISIRFHFKSTLSKELYLSEFSTYDGIKNYMKYMTDFIKEIDSQCINRAVNVREDFTLPSIARPNIYSKEEGQKLRDILLMWEEVNLREFKEGTIPFMFGLNEFNGDKIIFDSNDQCGEFLDRLTINYDGTIVECSGVFIDYYKPYQEELLQEGKKDLYEQALINERNSINPITASPEEIKKWKWRMQRGYRGNSLTYISLMLGVAQELCASRQIPSYFENKEMLLKYLNSFQLANACSKENFNTTGIPYLTSVGSIREYFNGVMEYGYKVRENELKASFKYSNKDAKFNQHREQGDENRYEYNVGK